MGPCGRRLRPRAWIPGWRDVDRWGVPEDDAGLYRAYFNDDVFRALCVSAVTSIVGAIGLVAAGTYHLASRPGSAEIIGIVGSIPSSERLWHFLGAAAIVAVVGYPISLGFAMLIVYVVPASRYLTTSSSRLYGRLSAALVLSLLLSVNVGSLFETPHGETFALWRFAPILVATSVGAIISQAQAHKTGLSAD